MSNNNKKDEEKKKNHATADEDATATPPLLDSSWQAALSHGDSLAVDGQYDEAIDAYAAALTLLPEASANASDRYRTFSHRSQSFLYLGRYAEALQDTHDASGLLAVGGGGGHAAELKLRPGETEICLKRQAQAYMGLHQYDEAGAALNQAIQLAELNHRPVEEYQGLLKQCATAAASQQDSPEQDGKSAAEKPATSTKAMAQAAPDASTASSTVAAPTATITTPAPAPAPPVATSATATATVTATTMSTNLLGPLPAAPKYQYYQSDKVMTIIILKAGVSRNDMMVDFDVDELTVKIRTADNSGREITVISGFLYEKVLPDLCKITIKPEKVLIKLRKEKEHYDWPELMSKKKKTKTSGGGNSTTTAGAGAGGANKPAATNNKAVVGTVTTEEARAIAAAKAKAAQASAAATATPAINGEGEGDGNNEKEGNNKTTTSSKIPRPYASHRDWDAIEKELADKEKNEQPEGEDATKKLFEHIYANADEDTRRAMIKSYQTSGGTVLSTNWNEVSATNYEQERTAPKGMEWKTWEGKKLPMKDDD